MQIVKRNLPSNQWECETFAKIISNSELMSSSWWQQLDSGINSRVEELLKESKNYENKKNSKKNRGKRSKKSVPKRK